MKRRTSQQIDEDLAKTLYVRLPHTIQSAQEVKELFLGDIKVKMPRQSARHCHIVFPSIEEKMKNLKNIKKLMIDGKHIIACSPRVNPSKEKKKKEKKIRVPKPTLESKVTKTIYVSNIKPGTKAQELKQAFPGCTSLVLLKAQNGKNRRAILNLGSIQLASEYLRKEREWPEVRGNRLIITTDTRNRNKNGRKKSVGLTIYDGDNERTNEKKSQQSDETDSPDDAKHGSEISEYSELEDDGETEESDQHEETKFEEE